MTEELMTVTKTIVFIFDPNEEAEAIGKFWKNTTGWAMNATTTSVTFQKVETKDYGPQKGVIPFGD